MPIFFEPFAATHLLFMKIALDLFQSIAHPPFPLPTCVQTTVIILEIIIFLALVLSADLLHIQVEHHL